MTLQKLNRALLRTLTRSPEAPAIIADRIEELEGENAKLRELGHALRQSADMIGYVQDADAYRNATRRIKAWDDFLAATKISTP